MGQQFYQMQLHASGVDGHPENSVLQELNILLIETFDMYRLTTYSGRIERKDSNLSLIHI